MAEKASPHGDIPLGQQTEYVSVYTPSLLCPIPREQSRSGLNLDLEKLPFKGVDIWTGYELSWLDGRGKPQVAVAEFTFTADSVAIVESKSFKLYLNSFNQTRFDSPQIVLRSLEADLSAAAGGAVMVQIFSMSQAVQRSIGHFAAENIDHLPVDIDEYHPNADLLTLEDPERIVHESLCSDLLKSNCPVTGQPDWASVYVRYHGSAIERESLLKYIVSFREHQDFHEHCVERMFADILKRCQPKELTVYARYTRRGGLDINPFRSNCGEEPVDVRLVRQ